MTGTGIGNRESSRRDKGDGGEGGSGSREDNVLIDETNAQLSSHLVRGSREHPVASVSLLPFFFHPFTHEIPLRAFREWPIAIKRNEAGQEKESQLKEKQTGPREGGWWRRGWNKDGCKLLGGGRKKGESIEKE